MSKKLFVGGLNFRTTDEGLRSAFEAFGSVVEAKVVVDRETGQSRGFGFVTFASAACARAVLLLQQGGGGHSGSDEKQRIINTRPTTFSPQLMLLLPSSSLSSSQQQLHRIHGKVVQCAMARPRVAAEAHHPQFEVLDQGMTAEARADLLARRAEGRAQCEAAVRRHNPWCVRACVRA